MAGALNARPSPELSGGWAGNAPLDGGRLLRAVIWWRTHDRVKATVRADQAGQVFGMICVVGGLYQGGRPGRPARGRHRSRKTLGSAMAKQNGEQQATVGEALAQRVEARQGAATGWAEALRELGAVDRAVYEAVAGTPTPELDGPFRRLSNAANNSRLWLGIAAAIAMSGGRRGRRAAMEGALAIGVTSAAINLGAKPLARRARPRPAGPGLAEGRGVRMPESASFPSGHAASAFAFAYAVGRHLPGLAVPLRMLAGGVAYSRVHTGVHYPGDVVIGSILGAGTAAMVAAACDRIPDHGSAGSPPHRQS
jgi:membrane-associated phospholipid phosphatase